MASPNAIKFLLVDDDSDDSFLFEEALKDLTTDVSLSVAINGFDALAKLEAERPLPDLIFLDLNMPLMDGKQLLVNLKADSTFRRIPVIMYTTSSLDRDVEYSLKNGALCFISKPHSMRDLLGILEPIAANVHADLKKTIQGLSGDVQTFVAC